MKITLEQAALPELEVVIRGELSSPEVAALLQKIGKKNSGKLIVNREEEQVLLDISQIIYLETADSRVKVITQTESYDTRQKLYEMMDTLRGFHFAQISKSTIVNIDFVKSIQAEFSGNYRIKLKGRKESLTVSRKYFKDFKERI